MGQKVNPKGIRIGYNQGWNSVWYAPKEKYADLLHEDIKVREFVFRKLQNAGVNDVIIKRSMNKILIEVSVARPGVVIGRGGAGIEALKKELNKMMEGAVEVKIFEIKRPEIKARLIAENIRGQLVRRIVPKFAVLRELENVKKSGVVKGIKIWVSGRIKGAEIARTEKFQWNSVPLQTLRADIDYAFLEAQVPNAGKHGIKVWVYLGEKTSLEDNK